MKMVIFSNLYRPEYLVSAGYTSSANLVRIKIIFLNSLNGISGLKVKYNNYTDVKYGEVFF